MTKTELISKIVEQELEGMSWKDLARYFYDVQEAEYITWTREALENYAKGSWPEHFNNSEFEQAA